MADLFRTHLAFLKLRPDAFKVLSLIHGRLHGAGRTAQIQASAGDLVHPLEALQVGLKSSVAVGLLLAQVQLGLQPAARPQVDRLFVLSAELESNPVPFVGLLGQIKAGCGLPPGLDLLVRLGFGVCPLGCLGL